MPKRGDPESPKGPKSREVTGYGCEEAVSSVSSLNLAARMQTTLFEPLAPLAPMDLEPAVAISESCVFITTMGAMRAIATDQGLIHLSFEDEDTPLTPGEPRHPILRDTKAQVEAYFAGNLEVFTIPLQLRGTPFQLSVWRALQEIPYGVTICYSDLAERLGVKSGQRAVGMANRTNPVAIIVPCHRVIQASGALCGYAGGLWRKQRLLGMEAGQHSLFG